MNKAVFLDRDGTINVDHGYVSTGDQFELVDGALEALKLMQEKGYLLFVVTNQSGVGRGFFTEEQYYKLTDYFLSLCKDQNVTIKKIVQCFHAPLEQCSCRKPKTGLVQQLQEEFSLDISGSFVVGDKTSDVQLAKNIGAQGILVLTGEAGNDRNFPKAKPLWTVLNLHEAAMRLPNAN